MRKKKLQTLYVLMRYDQDFDGTPIGVYSTWQKAKFARKQFAAYQGWGLGTMDWHAFTLDAIGEMIDIQVRGL